jgi:carboxyl-terminal processing protease
VILGISLTSIAIGCSSLASGDKYSKSKINQISKLLQHSYLRDIDNKKIEDSIYAGYVSGLEDPMTIYLNEEQFEKQQVLEEGKYIGTGLQFEWGLNGRYIIVTDIIKDSPASLEDIKIGDKIIEIDGIKVMLANETELYEKLSYTGDKPVTYTFEDNDGSRKRQIKLMSKIINIKSMSHKILKNNIGYVTVFAVKEGASKELEQIIKELEASGAKSFIFDLRNAYSNNIEEIYQMANLFINEKVAFKIKNKKGEIKEYKTMNAAYEEPVAILINERTKGAPEAFAAAIKDAKRGMIIGTASAGVGSVNEIIPLQDKTGLMVATGIIYTAGDISLKDKGVTPDIEIKSGVEAVIELITKGKIDEKNDLQLMEALNRLS